jgi:tetratricopeptide (TPR) repeat protein
MNKEKPVWRILNVIIIPLLVALIGVGVAVYVHNDTKNSTENKIVEALSERYASVDKEMNYEQALAAVDKDIELLKSENSTLQSKNADLKYEVSSLHTELSEAQSAFANSTDRADNIVRAESYVAVGDYETAIEILNSIAPKDGTVDALLKDYNIKFEMQISSKADSLVNEQRFDEAVSLIDNALRIVPNSHTLTVKRSEVENRKPVSMYLVDTLTPYTSNDFELISGYLEMGGERYRKSFTLQGYGGNGVSNAVYNLKGQYTSLSFTISVISSEGYLNNREQINIWLDDEVVETIDMSIEDIPKEYTFSLIGVQRLKLEIPRGNGFHSLVGVAEAILYK